LQPKENITNDNFIGTVNELKSVLLMAYENATSSQALAFSAKCLNIEGCPAWFRSQFALDNTSSMIGNVSSSIILVLALKTS
jgi:hypothetical protein